MDGTPPGVLRDRLRKARESNEYWRKEFDELQEFTTLEQQVVKADMDADLVKKNEFLESEVESLNLIVEENAGFLGEFANIFEEKRAYYTQLRSRGGVSTEGSEILLDDVVATFDELSLMLETKNIQKKHDSFAPLDTSALSTIEEGRESMDSAAAGQILYKSVDMIKFDDSSLQQLDNHPNMNTSTLDDAQRRITELQNVSSLLKSEVAHCMSELDSRDNQITLLERSLPLSHQSSDVWALCAKELESLERTFQETKLNEDEISEQLESALSLMRTGIEELLSSRCRLSQQVPQSANESLAPITDSFYSQQLCSVVLEASVNASAMNTSTIPSHLNQIVTDFNHLRECTLNAVSDFSSEMFHAINHLLRFEMVLDEAHGTNGSRPDSLSLRYKNALIHDFQDKAHQILRLPGYEENASLSQCHSSTSLSVGPASKPSGSIYCSADDETSQYMSATDGEGGFDAQPSVGDLSSEHLSSLWLAICDLECALVEIRVLHPSQKTEERIPESITYSQLLDTMCRLKEKLVQAHNELYDPNCTEFLSMDTSIFRASPLPLKPLQHNTINESDGKENSDKSYPKGTVEQLKKLLLESNEKLEELTRVKNEMNVKLSKESKGTDNTNILEDMNKLRVALDLEQGESARKDEIINSLKSEIDHKADSLKALEKHTHRLEADLACSKEKIRELNRLHGNMLSLEEKLLAELKARNELEDNLVEGHVKIAVLEDALETAKKDQDTLQAAEEEHQPGKYDLNNQLECVQEFQKTIEELRSTIGNHESSKLIIEEKLSAESRARGELEECLNEARAKIVSLEGALKTAQSELNSQIECAQEFQKIIEELRSTIDNHESSKLTIEEKLSAVSRARSELEESLNEARAKTVALEGALETANADQALAKADFDHQIECVQELQKTIEVHQSTINIQESYKLSLEEKLLAESKAKIELEEKLKGVTQKAVELEAALTAVNSHGNHEDLVDDLNKKMDKYERRLEDLKHSNETLNGNLSEEVRMRGVLEADVVRKTQELTHANNALTEHVNKISQLEECVEQLRSTMNDMETLNSEKLNDVLTEKSVLEDTLKLVREELAKSSSNTGKLQSALDAANEDTKKLQELERSFDELSAVKCDLQVALNAAEIDLVQLRSKEEAWQMEQNRLLEEVKQASVKVIELEEMLKDNSKEMKAVSTDRDRLEGDMESAIAKLDELQAGKKELECDRQIISDKLEAAMIKIDSLESELAKAGSAIVNFQQKVIELESKLASVKVNFNQLILNVGKVLRERGQQQCYLQMKLDFSVTENRNLQRRLSEAFENMEDEIAQQRQPLLLQIEELSHLRIKVAEDTRIIIEDMQSQLEASQIQTAALNETLQAAKDEKAGLLKVLERKEELVNDSLHKLASLEEELKMSKIAYDEIADRERSLKSELESALKNDISNNLSETVAAPYSPYKPYSPFGSPTSNRHSSVGNPINDDVSTYNTTINLERSMFISELASERTMCAVDPLSLTIVPENLITPTKAHFDADDDSSDEKFLTPVSSKRGPYTPVQSPTDTLNRSNFIKKMDEYETTKAENKVISEKLKACQEELMSLHKHLEKITADSDNSKRKLQVLVNSLMQIFYQSTNEVELDCSLTVLSQDMAKVQNSLLEYLGQSRNGLLENSYLMLSRLQQAEAQVKSTHENIQFISQDQKAIKVQMENLYSLRSDFSQMFSELENLFNLINALTLEHKVSVESLSSSNKALQVDLLELSLEKQALCHQLNDLEASQLDLKSLYENVVIKSEETLNQKNNLEKAVLDVLQLWYKDQFPVGTDLTTHLRSIFADLVEAKKSGLQRLEEQASFNDSVVVTCKELKNNFNCTISEVQIWQEEVRHCFEEITSAVASLGVANTSAQAEQSSLKLELEECHKSIEQYNINTTKHASEQNLLLEKLQQTKEHNDLLCTSNTKLSEKLMECELRMEELLSSNQKMNEKLAKFEKTVANLEKNLQETEGQSAAYKRKIEELSLTHSTEPSLTNESDFNDVVSSLIRVSAGKPIDFKCDAKYETVQKLRHIENVISKTNSVLEDMVLLLNVDVRDNMSSLESLYAHLKHFNIEDMVMCKEEFVKEVRGFEPDSTVDELLKLSLVELHTRMVSAIAHREELVIAEYQAEQDKILASKSHKLNQLEERIKYMADMIEELTDSNDKLEKALKESKLINKSLESADKFHKEQKNEKTMENSVIYQKETLALKERCSILETEVGSLKKVSEEYLAKLTAAEATLAHILQVILDDSRVKDCLQLHPDLSSSMSEIAANIFTKLDEIKDELEDKSNIELIASEKQQKFKEYENELIACRETASSLKAKLTSVVSEMEKKDTLVVRLESDKANLELQIAEQKKAIECLEKKMSAVLYDKEEQILGKVPDSIDRLSDLSSKLEHSQLDVKIKEVAKYCHTLKQELIGMLRLILTDNKNLNFHFETMKREVDRMSAENLKLNSLNELRTRVCLLEKENATLSHEKESVQNALKEMEQRQLKSSHDDRTCPHKDKLQECKRELLIIRERADGEKKNFEIMKKNLQEDLEFKSSAIKCLEEKNSKTVSEFMQRLAASSTSSNQLAKKLEESEEKLSLLREMYDQDKRRLDKDVENLVKENALLLAAKGFVESIGVDINKIHESLPEVLSKLNGYQTMLEENEDLKMQNENLDEEFGTLLKQLRFLETQNTEINKESEEAKEALEALRKNQVATEEIVQKAKMLEEELSAKIESEQRMVTELKSLENRLEALANQITEEKCSYEQLLRAYKQLESNLESRNQKMQQYVTELQSQENTIATQAKALKEMSATLETEKLQLVVLTQQNLTLQGELAALRTSHQSQLLSVSSRVELIPELELRLKQLTEQKDEALRRCQAAEGQIPIAERLLREKEKQIEAFKSHCDQMIRDKKEADNLFEAREKKTLEKLEKLKEELSDKVVRIVELETLLESSTSEIVSSYQNKVSALEQEIEELKRSSSQCSSFIRPSNPVVVVPKPSSEQETHDQRNLNRVIRDLEKKNSVLKKLCSQRRQKIHSYETVLLQNNIPIPNFDASS